MLFYHCFIHIGGFFFARKLDLHLIIMQPVYVKDDFFDSLSSGTFGRGGPNGRGRPSERRRVDTEVLDQNHLSSRVFHCCCFAHCYWCADVWRISEAQAALPWWRPRLPWRWAFPWFILRWQRLWKHGEGWPWEFLSSLGQWERLIIAAAAILAGVVVFCHMHEAHPLLLNK